MFPRESQSSAERHLLSSTYAPFPSPSPYNPYFATAGKGRGNNISNRSLVSKPKGRAWRRFWKRTLTLIFFPLATTGCYFTIWLRFLQHPDDPVKYAIADEAWIFYSWFVLGVFALEWSKYGLAGVESAMLQTSFWQAPNAAALITHSESLWSGPDGWFKFFLWLVSPQKRPMHRLWLLLAAVAFLT